MPQRMVPETKTPYLAGVVRDYSFMSNKIDSWRWPNIKNQLDEDLYMGHKDGIHGEIGRLNADYISQIFDEDMWIQSLENDIEIEVSITSTSRQTAQKIQKTISVEEG